MKVMEVRAVEYNLNELDQFNPNDFFRANRQELIADFEEAFSAFLGLQLPDELNEQQRASISRQKTDLLVAFISGHLNFFDPKSKVFKRINNELGTTSPSGLILPKKDLIRV